jgi:hypothetical protein
VDSKGKRGSHPPNKTFWEGNERKMKETNMLNINDRAILKSLITKKINTLEMKSSIFQNDEIEEKYKRSIKNLKSIYNKINRSWEKVTSKKQQGEPSLDREGGLERMYQFHDIFFDDVVLKTHNTGEKDGSQVCAACAEKHHFCDNPEVQVIAGLSHGFCGIFGCNNEADYSLEFAEGTLIQEDATRMKTFVVSATGKETLLEQEIEAESAEKAREHYFLQWRAGMVEALEAFFETFEVREV